MDPLSAFARTGGSPGPMESHLVSAATVGARLLGADDAVGLPPAALAWLRDAGVLGGLLDCLSPSAPPDAQKHAAAVLAHVGVAV